MVRMQPVASSSGERILFEERMRWPWRNLLLITLFAELVATAIVVLGHPTTGSTIFGYAAGTAGCAFWIALFQVSARRLWFRVGERTCAFGRCPPVPVSAIRDVERVDGRAEVQQQVDTLGKGAAFLGASANPKLMGVLVPPRSDHAVVVRVDPAASRTETFLLGSRRPRELVEALELTRESTALGSRHGSPRHT